ncbi:MAG: pantetheine-phosphate adenylyltransferase [Deltaproteobacteria bacterium]|nr:pantetheine-phosphate adenylyltransferase [Deltaproteobacteria bacterium]
MHTAICPGSFDPPTNGHLNIIERGLKLFDRLVVAIAVNTSKNPLFSADERVAMLREIFQAEPRIEVDAFEGLLVDYARRRHITTILRGIRTMSDYEYEFQMALVNKAMSPQMETVFMMTEGRYSHLSSTIIKDVIRFGGNATKMMHGIVEQRLRNKLNP